MAQFRSVRAPPSVAHVHLADVPPDRGAPFPDTMSSLSPPRRGLGSRPPASPATSSSSSSSSSAPSLSLSGLPSNFGGSKSRKRRRATPSSPSLPAAPEPPPGEWERHTRGIGSKILAKQGFSGRLGVHADGIHAPLQSVSRPTRLGLGAGNFDEWKPEEEETKRRDEETEKPRKKKWKKSAEGVTVRVRKPRLAVGEEKGGKEGHSELPEASKQPLFAVPEIAYNLRLLTDNARSSLDAAHRRRETEKLIRATTSAEREKLSAESLAAGEAVAYLNELRSRLTTLQRAYDTPNDEFEAALDEAARWVGKGAARYIAQQCLTEAIVEVVYSRAEGKVAECLSAGAQSRKGRIREMKHVGRVLALARGVVMQEMYIALCARLILPRMRRVVMRADWDAVEGAWVADVLRELRDMMPDAVMDAFAEESLVPRLVRSVEQWKDDDVPLHVWIHPWLPVVGRRGLGEVLGRVRVQVTKRLEKWSSRDGIERTRELVELVQRWTGVLSRRKLQMALARHVTVKLIRDVEWFCDDVNRLAEVEAGAAKPECFERMGVWSAVVSARMMGGRLEGMFVGMCRAMRRIVFESGGWREGAEYYRMWKGWLPRGVVGHVRGGLGAILFVIHAGRVEGREEVRRKLRGADVRGLLKNRFAGAKAEAVKRWKEGRVGLKEAVMGVAKREGLLVVGDGRAVEGVPTLRVGRVRVVLDGRRGVVGVVTGEGVKVVGMDELVALAR
ncbi:Tuftelin interacting protein 11, predicted [Chondrus crispus]|uniref:Tuftelin interacting protein 11, predicted n=1 Tax=Chondrus crispus TaxID=2769 RepID=R7QEA2_CHOCR|nr:Tuftelin interacting protein 11, predicted [Chondrus crispus]CDF36842.1 Tuftelin interacting protein 11, predicted [Chondrus crispus]|eukprot:XP_005716661.1 Tuftelin interacting protein 11, predicted [Chondrus crispus]